MVAVEDCPRCQPSKGGGWHPTRETSVLIPAGGRAHNVLVASTDTERDVLHTIRCRKDEAVRLARGKRKEKHAAVLAGWRALPPPPPPPDELLDKDAQQELVTELQHDKQRMLDAQRKFAEHIDRVHQSKRAAVDAHERKLQELERELMEVDDEIIERDRASIMAEESDLLSVILERRRIAKDKLDARRERSRLEMGIADQDALLKLGMMVPAHLPLAASASLQELPDGFSRKRGAQRKSCVEFSTAIIEDLETSIKTTEQHNTELTEQRERRRRRAREQKDNRVSAPMATATKFQVNDQVAEATTSLLKAELRHKGRDILLHGHGVSRKVEPDIGERRLEVDEERKLEADIQAATRALQNAESQYGCSTPVSPPSEPLVWSARLKEKPRSVSNISVSRELLRRGTNESLRGPSGGREGAVCDKPPYVERGVFTTDWGLSQQRSQGEEDLAELTEEDWQAEMEAVRHWELRELAALEAEDRSEHGRYERSKSIREKIANPNWRPWREKVPKAETKRHSRQKNNHFDMNAEVDMMATSEASTSAHTFGKAPRFGVGAAPVGLPTAEAGENTTTPPNSEIGHVRVSERVAEVEAREADACNNAPKTPPPP